MQSLLEFCIPTLLAPGNIPAIARMLPTKFVLMTRAKDVSLVEGHTTWKRLSEVCDVEIRCIDDLVTRDNHTASITLAFRRAILASGHAMSETCFILMNSDFLVADGSLTTVIRKIRNGCDCVLAGNFQIVAEEASRYLKPHIDRDSRSLTLDSRRLLKFSFSHLHPVTIANIVNVGIASNSHPNRLFWRVNENTLLGRFYLIHVVAIRPQVSGEFEVGSSYDYSFVPELCPQGNVHIIDDSDDYLVVEMQPRSHEMYMLQPARITPSALALALRKWTTAQHRENAKTTICFHSDDIPPGFQEARKEADAFIRSVVDHLSPVVQPHRNHPYWIGSIAVHGERLGRPMGAADWAHFSSQTVRRYGRSLTARLFGAVPGVTRCHPLWADYRPLNSRLDRLTPGTDALFVSNRFGAFADWLAKQPSMHAFEWETVLTLKAKTMKTMLGRFDACIVLFSMEELPTAPAVLDRLAAMLKPNGRIIAHLYPLKNSSAIQVATALMALFKMHLNVCNVQYVECSPFRERVQEHIVRIRRSAWPAPVVLLASTVLAPILFLHNSIFKEGRGTLPRACSSVTLELEVGHQDQALDAYRANTFEETVSIGSAAVMLISARMLDIMNDRGILSANDISTIHSGGSLIEASNDLIEFVQQRKGGDSP
jgi:hypothetical protein